MSKLSTAVDIYHNEGFQEVVKKSSQWLLTKTPIADRAQYLLTKRNIQKRMQEEENLEDILDTVFDVQPGWDTYQVYAIQHRDELRQLLLQIADLQPKTVLEIGTGCGGTFYAWCRYLDTADTIVSVDLPDGRWGIPVSERQTKIMRQFVPDKDLYFIRKDSHDRETLDTVRQRLNEEVDFLFIDGDHTYHGVKQDFEMYSDLVRNGGVIALHDIVSFPESSDILQARRERYPDIEERHLEWNESYSDINVDKFWNEITQVYETEKIISHPGQTWGGIGLVKV